MDVPEKLLKEIEGMLLTIPDDSLPSIPPFNEVQSISYGEKATSKFQSVTNFVVGKLSPLLLKRDSTTPFRICSIGCGNGYMDSIWLSALYKHCPDMKVQYVGVDIDDTACSFAQSKLSVLEFADIKILCCDIQDGIEESNFDFILAVNCFYYLKSLKKGLGVCKTSLAPQGVAVIVMCDFGPDMKLFHLFWKRQFGYEVSFSSDMTSALQELRIPFTDDIEEDTVDMTECFRDNFATESQKGVLNIHTQVDTFKYPNSLTQKCIDYMRSISIVPDESSQILLYFNRHYFTL